MNQFNTAIARSQEQVLATNKVLKNTYMLLAATLAFSAVTAMISLALAVPAWTYLASVVVSMVLGIFVLPRTANSATGIGVIFAITGLLGFGLGAILQFYLALPKGPQIIATAFGGTGVIFLGLSGYALTSKRDFSFMGGFLFAGMIAVLVAIVANIFFAAPDHFHGSAHPLGNFNGLGNIVHQHPAAESTAEEGGVHLDLSIAETGDSGRDFLSALRVLCGRPDFTAVAGDMGRAVHGFRCGMGLVG